ncbi:flagellar hook-associated protein FlgL [Actinotalea solisilvae]|uniref:flagellar hook-associated protein FlgL n=1 Tax=Actinotalea solisilvae TaxID=2072922 RepID=UPI0018F1A010|nr:flagellar hook-associated protein FlgL [Actinotalea solisilvae]
MINRVTQQTVQRSTLANLQLNLGRMADLQAKMSGGKVLTKPSDDPSATGQAMQVRAERRAAEQHARNADDGAGWLTTVDGALQTSVAALRKARDLTVQGANTGSMSQTARDAIAVELEGIRDALLDQANTRYNGRSVFAGTSDAAQAFEPGSYTWNGSATGSVQRRLGPEQTVRADQDGAAAFGQGAGSAFALIDQIVADLRGGVNVGARLSEIDDRMTVMLGELADVGARHNQVMGAQSALKKTTMDLSSQLSGIEDIDLAEIIVELQMQEVAYQGALGATARVLQPSLMEFLR